MRPLRAGLVWLLHPVRRRLLIARLRRRGMPRAVLFVCHGNICRSPYAAGAFRRRLPRRFVDRVHSYSAGFVGANRHSPDEAIVVASERGVDLSRHMSETLSPHAVRLAGLIVVMDPYQRIALQSLFGGDRDIIILGDLDPLPSSSRLIRDPVEQPEEVYVESYDRIDRCLDVLVAALSGGSARRI